jgi:unconventional prefoldin RPB5 interactor 1
VYRQKLDQWEKFEEDYLKIYEKLRTLTDTTSHDVFVPFGKVAFVPGKLVHTNALMVLLGDNWFAERSAKQTQDIVQRRLRCMALLKRVCLVAFL